MLRKRTRSVIEWSLTAIVVPGLVVMVCASAARAEPATKARANATPWSVLLATDSG